MRSDTILVTPDTLGKALDMLEKTAKYIGYSDAYSSRIRLLGEELVSGIHFLMDEVDAKLWVETDSDAMNIHLLLEGMLSDSARERLVELSRSKHNEHPKGLLSRIAAIFSDAFMSDTAGYVPMFVDGSDAAVQFYMPVSLLDVAQPEQPDELKGVEANILQGIADDVTVCARPTHAELVVIKKLPKE